MNKLIILRGNSGSGKTSVAKALQQKFGSGTMLISHDVVRMEFLNVRGAEGIVKSEKLMIDLLKYGKENSKITIIEGILPSNDYENYSMWLAMNSVKIFLLTIMTYHLRKL